MILILTGCSEKKQIVKAVVKEVDKIVVKEIDKELTKPCRIYYPTMENPTRQDRYNAYKIQRLIIEQDCNVRLKAIEDI